MCEEIIISLLRYFYIHQRSIPWRSCVFGKFGAEHLVLDYLLKTDLKTIGPIQKNHNDLCQQLIILTDALPTLGSGLQYYNKMVEDEVSI